MKTLRNTIAQVSKHKLVPATLLETAGNLCTVRLGNNGRVLHGVPYSGGPAPSGASVQVDYSSGSPIVLAQGQLYVPEPEPKKIVPRPTAPEIPPPPGDMIERYVEGKLVEVYEPSEDGMNTALGEAEAGHLIKLPVITLAMDFTVPAGVTVTGESRLSSLINGTVTLSKGAKIEKLHILDHAEEVGDVTAVIANGDSTVNDCNAWACNCIGGNSYGVKVTAGKLAITNSSVSGEAEAGAGYGINAVAGSATASSSTIFGSTNRFNGTVYVYNHVLGSPNCSCLLWSGTTIGDLYSYPSMAQIVTPGQGSVTLGEAAALSEIVRHNLAYAPTGFGMTEKYAFIGDAGRIVRVNLDGSGSNSMQCQEAWDDDYYDAYLSELLVLNDDECIVYYVASSGSGDDAVMVRLNFATQTRTELDRRNAYNPCLILGEQVALSEIKYLTRARFEGEDKVVALVAYDTTAASPNWIAVQVFLYDLNTSVFTALNPQKVSPHTERNVYLEDAAFKACPRFYQGHVVTHFPMTISNYPDTPSGNTFPVVDVNILTNSFHIEDNWIQDAAVEFPGYNGAMDYNAGAYYFSNSYWNGSENHALMRYTIADQDIDAVTVRPDVSSLAQGPTTLFAITALGEDIYEKCDIESVPGMGMIAQNAVWNWGHTVPDEQNEVIWTTEDDVWDLLAPARLLGVSTNTGETIKTIDLAFTEDFYKYLNGRNFMVVGILNGYLVLYIDSYAGGIYQHEFVILKEDAA